MKTQAYVVCGLGFGVLLAAIPVDAHHSFAAQYDSEQVVTLTGIVTKVDWMNPHIYIYVDVTNEETGEVEPWEFEMGGPNALVRLGWTRNSLQPDDEIRVEGTRARDGSNLVNTRNVVMTSTGRRMFAGSSEGDDQ